jgi:DNA replication protein DnaC
MTITTTLDQLRQLRLHGFRECLEEQLHNPEYGTLAFEERLSLLVDRERMRRGERRWARRIRLAAFPLRAAMEELDFTSGRGLDRRQVLALSQCEWIGEHQQVLVTGATGVGKTYLACALGDAACRHDYMVRYERTSRFLLALQAARQEGEYQRVLTRFSHCDLLILDEWMRDVITPVQAQDLMEITEDRFGRLSTMVVSQVPVGDWHIRFPDPTLADAILDRLVHNAHRITLQGESQRKLRSRVISSAG